MIVGSHKRVAVFTHWLTDTWRMYRFVQQAPTPKVSESANDTAVIVTPWFGSSVPWFSLVVGLLISTRGPRVTFVLDDLLFGSDSFGWRLQLRCLRAVLAAVGRRYKVLRLSQFSPEQDAEIEISPTIKKLGYLNAVWANKGESGVDAETYRESLEQLRRSSSAICALLDLHPQKLLFLPGGVCANSGLWLSQGTSKGVRVSTFDSGGHGVLLLAAEGVACQLQDIPRAFETLLYEVRTREERQAVVQISEGEMAKRRSGTDRFSSQKSRRTERMTEFDGGILIALNSPWDSAALGLHAIFEDSRDWIVQTVGYLLDSAYDGPVLVRQHPAERNPIAKSGDDTEALLQKKFGANPQLHFIGADADVNTYDLIEQVEVVVAYTSTVGVEAAALGKPVITEARSYYCDLGFVYSAKSHKAYLRLLEKAVCGECVVTAEMRERAIFCYYITQCCNWLNTPFTVPDFPSWSRRPFSHLVKDEAVGMMLESLIDNKPISTLVHRQNWPARGLSRMTN